MRDISFVPGARFGTYTVTDTSCKRVGKYVLGLVVCDCGNVKWMRRSAAAHKAHINRCTCKYGPKKAYTSPSEAARNGAYARYVANAKYVGKRMDITRDQFIKLVAKPCGYCGAPPSNIYRAGKRKAEIFKYSGLDKVDPAGHYTMDNVVPCCPMCNHAKRDHTQQDFIEWLVRAAEFITDTDNE